MVALSTGYRALHSATPRSGYRGSDLVLWHLTVSFCSCTDFPLLGVQLPWSQSRGDE